MTSLDNEWIEYLKQNGIDMSYSKDFIDDIVEEKEITIAENKENKENKVVSHEYELSISTKTEKLFLNTAIDIYDIF